MKPCKNPLVQEFLDEMKEFNLEQYQILQALRSLVASCHDLLEERMMYGGIMFSLEEDFGGIFPRKKHISFEFSQGYLLKDPEAILEGKGKFRRHLKIREMADLEEKKILFFVRQAVELEN